MVELRPVSLPIQGDLLDVVGVTGPEPHGPYGVLRWRLWLRQWPLPGSREQRPRFYFVELLGAASVPWRVGDPVPPALAPQWVRLREPWAVDYLG